MCRKVTAIPPLWCVFIAGVANGSDYEEYGCDANGNRTLLRRRRAPAMACSLGGAPWPD